MKFDDETATLYVYEKDCKQIGAYELLVNEYYRLNGKLKRVICEPFVHQQLFMIGKLDCNGGRTWTLLPCGDAPVECAWRNNDR